MTANINILLIDTRVSHYEAIIAAVDPALSLGIKFDYYTDTFDTLKERMRSSGILANSVGLVQHKYKMPTFKIVDAQTTTSIIEQVETQDNELSTWAPLKEFIEWCKTELNTAHFDMMACALYSNPDWKYIIDTLSVQTGVEIRASTDDTGSSSLGGNWFLESHVGINLKEVYFNDSINGYMGLLDSEMFNVDSLYLYTTQVPTITTLPPRPTRPTNPTLPLSAPTLPSRPTLPTGTLPYSIFGGPSGTGGYAVSYGDDDHTNSFSKVSSQLKSNVLYLFSTPMALKSDNNGSLVLWGYHVSSAKTIAPASENLSSNVVSVCTYSDYLYALKSNGAVVGYGNFTNFPAFPISDLSSGVNFIATSYQDIACLKSDGSIRGWGCEVFKNSSSVPAFIYPAGSNLNSGFVKLVTIGWPPAFAAIKTDGSVVFFGGTSASTNYLSNPTTFYPAGSNITSGVVDVFLTIGYNYQACYIALKSDGSLVAWGAGASSLSTYITGKTAVKIIKMNDRPLILLSDGTYIDTLSGASAGTQTNIVDAIESNGRCIFLRSDGTLAWRGGESFQYFFSTDISVHTNVVKMWNLYEGQFNQGAVILNSSGQLRMLANNVLLLSNVNNATVSNNMICAITSDGKVTTIKNRGTTPFSTWLNFDRIYANNASLESATSVLAVTNSTNVSVVLKTQLILPYFFSFNGTNAYATCPYNSYNTALDLVTGYTGTSASIGGNAFTIETWYYQPAQTLNSTIVDRGNSCYLFQVSPNANTITANLGCLGFANTAISGTWLYATSATVTTGKWCHVAITRSGTSYQFYINGVLKQTMTGPATLNRDDGVLGIGTQLAGTTTGSNFTNSGCSMYDLRLWNVCRTPAQIQSYMNVLVQPSSAGLVANYLLNDNSGTFYDRTRNALHCTIANYSSSLWVTTFAFPNIGLYLNPDFSFIRGIFLPGVSSALYINLKYTDFTGANLTGINFSNVDLTGANFSGANLTNVNFTNAILKGITINNSTKFTGANFNNAMVYSIIGSINPSLLSNVGNVSYYFSNVGLSNPLIDYNNANTSIALPPTSITNYVVYFANYYNYKKSNARFYISWATDSNALSFSSLSYTPKVRFQVVHQTTNVVGIDVLFDYAAGKGCIESTVPFYIDSENEGNNNVSDSGASANYNVPIRYRLWGELLNGTRSSSYVNVNQSSTAVTQFALYDDIITNAPSWYTSITTNSNSSNYYNNIGYISNSNNALFLYGKQTFANGVISAGATFYNWATSTPYIIPATTGAWRKYVIDPTGNSVFINTWNSTNEGWCRYVFSTNTLTVLSPGQFGSASNTVCNSTGTRAYTNDIEKLLVYNLTTSTASVVSIGSISNLRDMFIDKNDKYIVTSSYNVATVYIINIVNDAFTKISTGQIVSNDTLAWASFDDSSTYCYAAFLGSRNVVYRIKLSDATWSLFITLPVAASSGKITVINKYLYIFGINSISQYSMIDTTSATPTITVNAFPTGYDTVLEVYETKQKNNVYCVVNYNGVPTIMHFTGFPNTFNNSSGIMLGPSMNYSNANLTNYNISNMPYMTNSNFTNTTLTNANFSNSNLENASFSGNIVDFSTANFTGANINNISFGDSLFDYRLDANNNATVFNYRGGASLVFPEKVSDTYTITAVADNMSWAGVPTGFTNFSFSATSKLVTIGQNAFIFLKLGIITSPFGPNTFFPPTLTTISYRSFYYSTVMNHPRATIILPQSVVTVGYTAFSQFGAQVQLKPTLEWSSVLTTPRATGSTFTYVATIRGPIGYTGYNNGYNPLSNRPIYYGSSNTSIATIDSSTGLVTLVGIGDVTFTSSRDADAGEMTYTAADTITSTTLTVTKGTPTLSAFSIAQKYFGDAAFQVTAPSSQNTVGTFHYTSNNASVATITDAGMITIVGVGSTTITANQDETTYFYAPTAITAIFTTVLKATPILSEFTIAPKYIGDSVFTLTAPTSISYSYVKNYPTPNTQLTNFPRISTLTHWEISISFNKTAVLSRYEFLMGNPISTTSGWAFFLNPGGGVHIVSYTEGIYWDFLSGILINTNYVLTIQRTPTHLYVFLKNVSTGVTVSSNRDYISDGLNLILTPDNICTFGTNNPPTTLSGIVSSITVKDPRTTEVSNGLLRYAVKYTYANMFSSIAAGSEIMDSAMSLNGMYQTVTTYKNGFWLSANYGATWTNKSPSSTAVGSVIYRGVAISSSGQYQSVCEYAGYIYVSNDYGATWTKPATITGAKNFMAIKMSDSGLHQTCVADNDYIYTSSDSGATWTQKTSIGLKSYYDVAMSADGSIQYAVALNGGGILKSTDKWATSTSVTTGLTQNKVGSIEISSTGTYITIVSFTDTGVNDPVILSKDGGSTWTSFDPNGSSKTGWTSSNVGMSADGRVQMLCYNTAAYTGGLYFSIDYGTTWTNDVSINNSPCGVSVSRDGTYMLSGSSDLVIYNIFSDMATIPASKKVATIVELTGQVTIVGAGLVTVTASQDLTTNYNAPTPISAKFLVNKVTPTLSNVTVSKTYGDVAFQVAAPAGSSTSGGTMRYAFLSGNNTVASITETGLITVNNVGTVVFSAKQDETSSFYAPTPVTVTLTVSKATPTLSNFTIAPKYIGDSVFTLTTPTGSSVSGGTMRYAVKYTYANMFSSIAAGSEIMDSAMSLNGMYQTLTTYKNGFWLSSNYGATWTNKSPSSTAVGSVVYKAVAMSSSGQYQSVCVYAGYIYVSNDYGATWTKPATITGAKNFMAIKMSDSGLHQTCVADNDYIYTSSDSGATWTQKTSIGLKSYYDVAMSADGSIQYAVALNGGGILKSTDKWATSTSVTTGLTQNKVGSIEISSTGTYITIVSFTDTGVNDPVILSKDGGSTWTSFDPNGSSKTGWTSSNVGMSADGRVQMLCYNTAAYTGGLYFSIDYGTTWTNDVSINNSPCGVSVSRDGTYMLSGSSDLVIYNIFSDMATIPASKKVATIVELTGQVTIVGAGLVTVTASQDLTTNYNAPTPISAKFLVNKVTPTLSNVTVSKTYGDVAFQVAAPAGSSTSGGTMRYAFLSGNNTVASITETGLITVNNVGTVVFSAKQDETSSYNAPTPVTVTLTVGKATPTIEISNISKSTVDPTFTFASSSASDGARTFSSSAPGVATINSSSGLVTIVGIVGTTTITVSQVVSTNYNAPSNATATLTVIKGTPTLSAFSIAPKIFGDLPFPVTAPSSQNTVGTFHYTSDTPGVATITDSGTITIVGAGFTTITVNQDANTNFDAPTAITAILTVAKATPTIVVSNITKSSIDPTFTFARSTASDGALSFSSDSESVAKVNSVSGLVTIVGIAGTATITVSQGASTNYNAPPDATATLTVTAGTLTNATIPSGADLSGKNLSGASLVGATLANVVLSNSNLNGADFSGANVAGTDFTNASIVGATNLPTFSTKQKLQLLYNANNAGANISQLQFSAPLSVSELNAALSVPIPELSSVNTEFLIAAPVYDESNVKTVTIAPSSISTANNTSFYIPLNVNETVKMNGVSFTLNASNQLLDNNGIVLKLIVINGYPFKIYAGSIILVNMANLVSKIVFGSGGQEITLYDIISSMISDAITQHLTP